MPPHFMEKFFKIYFGFLFERGLILSDSDEYIFYLFSPKQMLRCLFENWY